MAIRGIKATNVPLMMGGFDKIIGRMEIDFGTGDFTGQLDPELAEQIVHAFDEGLLGVIFSGRAHVGANPQMLIQGYFNLQKGREISNEIAELRNVQKALKDAFYHRELDGGPKAALEHPLFLEAEKRISKLQEELTLLI